MSIEYIVNHRNHNNDLVHVRVDGMTNEQCNIDQLRHFSVLTSLPEGDKWTWCTRCRNVSAGGVP